MSEKKSFLKSSKRIVLLFDIIFLLFVLISVFAYFQISKKVLNYMKNEKIEIAKDILIKESLSIRKYVDLRLQETNKKVREELKERYKHGFFLMNYLYENANKNGVDEAYVKNAIRNLLRKITFHNGLEYFYIMDDRGNLLMNSVFPELEGKNILDLQGGDGKFFVREVIKKALTEKEGFVEYYWRYKNTVELKKKVTYFGFFKPYRWILGMTVFYEDVIKEVKQDILNKLKNIVFSQEIYGLVVDKTSKKVLLKINDYGDFSIPNDYPPLTFAEFTYDNVKYLYYVEPIDSAKWDIIVLTPYSRIESLVSSVKSEYYDLIKGYIYLYIFAVVFLIGLHIYGIFYIQKRVMEDFEKLTKFIVNSDTKEKNFDFRYYELQQITDLYQSVLEQIKTEKSLREVLLENLDKGVLLLSESLEIEYVNSAAEEILRTEKGELLGRNFYKIFKMFDIETMNPISADDCYIGKFEYKGKISKRLYISAYDGNIVPVEVSYLYLQLDNEKKPFIVFEDISEQIKREKQLIELKSRAEEISEMKSQFIANMSHEIRTPLTGIIGFVDLLLKTDLSEEQKRYVEIINQSSQNLLNIINDILEASKIERKKIVLEKRNFNLKVLINECVNTFVSNALQKGIKIIADIDEDVPETLKGDKFRLTQVLNNLLGNAVKFTKEGKIKISVKKLEEKDKYVKLKFSVKDTGIGIPRDKQKSIFDAFVQADLSSTRRFGGTGLGLHISYEIVKMMGGELKVNSEPGKGAEFFFELELEKGDTIELVKVRKSETFKGAKVLIAEDDVFNQEFFKIVFQRFDVKTDIVNNGEEALEKLRECDYDIVFMDIEMPVMGGMEFVKVLKESKDIKNKDFVLIALTGHTEKDFVDRLLKAGFDDYVFKPVDVSELGEKLEKYLDKKEDSLRSYFDFEELEKIVGDVDKFFKNVLGKFINEIELGLKSIRESVLKEDFEKAKKYAHGIKGAAGNIRAKQIFDYAKGVELSAENRNKKEVLELVDRIEEIIQKIKRCYYGESKDTFTG